MDVAARTEKLTPEVREFLAEPKKLLIDGQWVDAASGRTFASVDPTTGKDLVEVQFAGEEDVRRAVTAARAAFEDGRWSQLDPRKRAKVLYSIADGIEAGMASIGQLDVLDNGKPFAFATGEVYHAASVFRYFAGLADKIFGETNPTEPGRFIYTLREPVGVCAQVIPWNFPSAMVAWKLGPALAFGNTVVLKPAEETPLEALWIAKLAQEAGLPDGVLNVLTGDGETTGAALVRHPEIDKIAFTGSTEVGRLMLQAASTNMARVTLELGGKSPNVVFPDADFTQAIPQAAFGIFFNSGQMCTAASRLLVQRDAHDEFVEQLTAAAGAWKVGDGLEDGTLVGPLVSKQQFDRVSSYLEIGASEAEVRIGGSPVAGTDGFFVEPTIFTGVQPSMRIAQEEIFGPVLSVLTFDDVDDAIRIANDTTYGLAAAVWTKDLSVAHKVARGIRAGTVWVNTYGVNDAGAPTGGFKNSGFGRELGIHAAEAYTELKTVWMQL
ncbi:MAG TPA: aldehyde dehydrogenase family protein [Actinomycetota bacterium]